jgi:magnesium transporter
VEVLTQLDRGTIGEQLARDEFFWLDLFAPTPEQLDELGPLLKLHPIALEDTREFGQRPKVDIYEDNLLVVFYTARVDQHDTGPTVDPVEVHVYVAGGYLVTVRHSRCDLLEGLHDTLAPSGTDDEDYLVYRIFDSLTDAFYPAIDQLEQRIDALEAEVLSRARPQQRETIYRLRQDVRELNRIVVAQRDQFQNVSEAVRNLAGLTRGSREYLRDVGDHLTQVAGEFQRQGEDLNALTGTYFAANSDRLNAVATRLTIFSSLFLVWTLVTGFFGQNFGWLVDHIAGFSHFLIFGVGGLVVPTVILLTVFWVKRRDWF